MFAASPLTSSFMQQLHHHSVHLMKGGAAGQNIKNITADKDDANATKRACVIVYLSEDPETLIKEYMDAEENQEAMRQMILGIFTIRKEGAEPTGDLEDVGVITEDAEVLHDLGNTADAVAVSFGLIYPLDWNLPTKLKYTSEVLQRTVTETVCRQKLKW